ncbi:MAG TPA: alpha-ketoglutarate-dependent dioxygenase AlkB [Caulobacteraceae bacterium]|jgi:alkylated DNA repair dioxygenase AlkB|nr:alpha-ketoglutarate-dependent dioxygenase AlkB [Caulobacteraceae bacterium]
MSAPQLDLFQPDPTLPEGLRYQPELITPDEEARLVETFAELPFKPFEFHGYLGKRRVVAFGWRYDYGARAVDEAAPIPDFLKPIRERAAAFAGLAPEDLQQAMINEYEPGAGIGWHRDKPQFGEVVGLSLLSACNLRFRRKTPDGWERRSLKPEPRSAYLLTGPARSQWQHSIPGVPALRYSVNFRTYLGD